MALTCVRGPRTVPNRLRFRQEPSLESKMRAKRRGARMNSRVPVAIEWEESQATPHQEHAHTRVVNFYGCLLVSPQAMPLEQRLVVTNLANQRSSGAVVVYTGNTAVDGWEVGVELVNPRMDFWGLEL